MTDEGKRKSADVRQPARWLSGANWKQWVVVVLLALLAIFVLQNTRVVEVRLLFWKIEMSRALMLLGMLIVGLIGGWFLGALVRRPKS